MRTAAKRDVSESEIVDHLEAVGCTVYRMDRPVDLLVHIPGDQFGRAVLFECKSDGGRLTKAQKEFSREWPGRVHVVYSGKQAIDIVAMYRGRIPRP
jgi:hypothetical protein